MSRVILARGGVFVGDDVRGIRARGGSAAKASKRGKEKCCESGEGRTHDGPFIRAVDEW